MGLIMSIFGWKKYFSQGKDKTNLQRRQNQIWNYFN